MAAEAMVRSPAPPAMTRDSGLFPIPLARQEPPPAGHATKRIRLDAQGRRSPLTRLQLLATSMCSG